MIPRDPHALLLAILSTSVLVLASCSLSHHQQGARFAEQGRWDEAVSAYRQALNENPFDQDLQAELVQAKVQAAEAHYRNGMQALEQSRVEEALHTLELAVALDPSRREYHFAVTEARRLKRAREQVRAAEQLTSLGRWDDALVAYERAVALHALVLAPAREELARTRAAYEQARHQTVALKDRRKQQAHVRELERRLEGVWAALPAEREFASLAIEIAELARRVGVSVPGMTHSHKKGKDGLPGEATLMFHATGTYQDIYTFLQKLETMEPYLAIEQVDASRATGPEARRRGAVRFNIRVATFLKDSRASSEPS